MSAWRGGDAGNRTTQRAEIHSSLRTVKTFPHASGPSLVPYEILGWQALAWGILSADAFAGKNVEILRAAFYPVRSALTNL